MKDSSFGQVIFWLCVIGLTLAVAATKCCSSDDAARSALLDAGYTEIRTTGFQFGECGDDAQCTGFSAIGPSGRRVKGAVGCGWFFKGCTVRISSR